MSVEKRSTKVDISVIIPTLNRAVLLDQVLAAVLKQTFPQERFEVIIVDNGSTDNTAEICEKWQNQFLYFRYLYDNHPGLHVGRNLGCMEAQSNILVYGDDDLFPSETWLEGMYRGLTETDAVLVGGSILPKYEGNPPTFLKKFWQREGEVRMMIAFSCIIFPPQKQYVKPEYIFGCSFGVKKDIVVKAGGFHPDSMPEKYIMYRGDGETYISRYIKKNGLKALVLPEIFAEHLVSHSRMSEERIIQVGYRNGISETYTVLREASSYRRMLMSICSIMYRTWKEAKHSTNKVIKRERKERLRGIIYLTKCFMTDERVREWVRRDNYFNENGFIQK